MGGTAALLAIGLAAGQALAVPAGQTWVNAYQMGTIVASITASDGAFFGVYCAADQPERAAYLTFETPALPRPADEVIEVRVIVGADSFAFAFEDGGYYFQPMGEDETAGFAALVKTLRASADENFRVGVADRGVSETFPLAGAATALSDGEGTIADACLR